MVTSFIRGSTDKEKKCKMSGSPCTGCLFDCHSRTVGARRLNFTYVIAPDGVRWATVFQIFQKIKILKLGLRDHPARGPNICEIQPPGSNGSGLRAEKASCRAALGQNSRKRLGNQSFFRGE